VAIWLGGSRSPVDRTLQPAVGRHRLACLVLDWPSAGDSGPFIRRFIDDPPVFKAARQESSIAGLARRPLEIFSPQMIRINQDPFETSRFSPDVLVDNKKSLVVRVTCRWRRYETLSDRRLTWWFMLVLPLPAADPLGKTRDLH